MGLGRGGRRKSDEGRNREKSPKIEDSEGSS